MGIIIISGLLVAIGIGLIIWGNSNKCSFDMEDVSVITGIAFLIIFGLVFVISGLCTLTLKDDFAYTESQYANLKEQIETVTYDDIVTDANLRNQVLEMNNTIAKHRNYCHNFWAGVYYSEDIGKLENLSWKSSKNGKD